MTGNFDDEENDDVYVVSSDETSGEVIETQPDSAVSDTYEAAAEAQHKADEAVASGDYAAASQHREDAENFAIAAGDYAALTGADSSELDMAADQHDKAQYHEEQQAIHAQQGDYEAAREDAANAATYQQWADGNAGGADHSGQAEAEHASMDWAVWEQKSADQDAESADAYAAVGDAERAQYYAENAADHQQSADQYGDAGEHGGDAGVYDASSETASGTYDSSSYDSGSSSGSGADSAGSADTTADTSAE